MKPISIRTTPRMIILLCTLLLVLPIRFARKLQLRSGRAQSEVCRSGEATGMSRPRAEYDQRRQIHRYGFEFSVRG
jgi:hypothetical protein